MCTAPHGQASPPSCKQVVNIALCCCSTASASASAVTVRPQFLVSPLGAQKEVGAGEALKFTNQQNSTINFHNPARKRVWVVVCGINVLCISIFLEARATNRIRQKDITFLTWYLLDTHFHYFPSKRN